MNINTFTQKQIDFIVDRIKSILGGDLFDLQVFTGNGMSESQIIEIFYRIVLDEIGMNKISHELDAETLNTVIRIIKESFPPGNTKSDWKKLKEQIPDPTDSFLKEKLINKLDKYGEDKYWEVKPSKFPSPMVKRFQKLGNCKLQRR